MQRVVADIGNTRIKWGRCGPARVEESVALPPDDPLAWQRQAEAWRLDSAEWIMGGVQPATASRLHAWLIERGHSARCIDSHRQLPLRVKVDYPDRVGLDRLFNAVAAHAACNESAIIVDAGSAVTIDQVDADGAFLGGAIVPGLRLMALALHEHTAQLPLVEVQSLHEPPAKNTVAAIEAGILHTLLGGIERLARRMNATRIYLTGGDASLLEPLLDVPCTLWPTMTLDGILRSAERVGETGV